MNPLSVSVVGGGTGGRLSLEAAAASEYFKPVALADLRPEIGVELSRKYSEVRMFTDFHEMFQTCRTDVVCVSTYPPSHEIVTLEAVKQRSIPMATPHGLMVRRCPLEIIERTQNGEIGELKLIEIQSPKWDIINAGIHWLNFAINLN